MPIFDAEAILLEGQFTPSYKRLRELNDSEVGAEISLTTRQHGRVVVHVTNTIEDVANLKITLPKDQVLDIFLQQDVDGPIEAVPVIEAGEFTVGSTALAGLYLPSTFNQSVYAKNLDTGGRTFVHALHAYLHLQVPPIEAVPWETDDLML